MSNVTDSKTIRISLLVTIDFAHCQQTLTCQYSCQYIICLPQFMIMNETSLDRLYIWQMTRLQNHWFFACFFTFFHFISLFLTFETFLAKKSLLKTPPDLRPHWDTNTLQFTEFRWCLAFSHPLPTNFIFVFVQVRLRHVFCPPICPPTAVLYLSLF